MYAYGFRFYFTPLTGVLFTFPSRYWYTIGRQGVFSLGRWSSQIQTGLHVSRPTQVPPSPLSISHTRLSLSLVGLSRPFCYLLMDRFRGPSNPTQHAAWFRLLRFRSPLLTESLLISSPSGTEMFHFPEFASCSLWIQPQDDWT